MPPRGAGADGPPPPPPLGQTPERIQALYEQLDIVSRIPAYHKLTVETMNYVFVGSVVSRVISAVTRQETGDDTVRFIKNVISDALQLAARYPEYEEVLVRKVLSCRNAVGNLRTAYSGKQVIVAALNGILELYLDDQSIRNTIAVHRADQARAVEPQHATGQVRQAGSPQQPAASDVVIHEDAGPVPDALDDGQEHW